MNLIKTYTLVAAAVIGSSAVAGASAPHGIGFGYSTQEDAVEQGTNKKEDLSVAIKLSDPMLVGRKVVGVKVPVNFTQNVRYDAWLSTELKIDKSDGVRKNAPDVETVECTVEDGYAVATFTTPYTIPAEGVYVGYSITWGSGDAFAPFPLMVSREKVKDSFYIFGNKTYISWKDRTNDLNCTSALMAIIDPEGFHDGELSLTALKNVNVNGEAEKNTIPATVVTKGVEPVENFEYTYEIGPIKGSGIYTFRKPLRNQYGLVKNVDLELPTLDQGGSFQGRFTITKVNGKDNSSDKPTATATVNVLEFKPTRMAVLEEYTGTWCQYCPRGWLGLEMMYERYPNRFIGISYHGGDVMEMAGGCPLVSNHLPDAWMDRTRNTDAYTGDYSTNTFGIDKVWEEACLELSEASIYVNSEWLDDNRLKAISYTTFAADYSDDDYRVEYVLLADDLHGDTKDWYQANGFSGDKNWSDAPGMEQFVEAPSALTDFHYNSVAVLTSGLVGVADSLCGVQTGKTIEHEFIFDLSQAVNTRGESLIQDRAKLRVVAMVLENDYYYDYGKIVNANICQAGNISGVNSLVGTDKEVESVTWHDLAGRRVNADHVGLVIRTTRYTDGSVKSEKIMNNQ